MRSLAAFLPALLFLTAGCSTETRLIIGSSTGGQVLVLEEILAAEPIGAEQAVRAINLGRSDHLSYHLVQVRDRESPHRHAEHDLSVSLLRGEGVLHVGDRTVPMQAGDGAFVPRDTPHFFVNAGSAPAVALVTFGPPSDGSDSIPVPDPSLPAR